jgi:hypothetical protein
VLVDDSTSVSSEMDVDAAEFSEDSEMASLVESVSTFS